jgi:choline dehydrogenase
VQQSALEGIRIMTYERAEMAQHSNDSDARFAARVRSNQQQLSANLSPYYDFIVCGSGSSGSVVARRLAENPDVNVLIVEAGGSDDISDVVVPEQWVSNIGSERDWNYCGAPNPHVNYRSIGYPMGKVLGGGSSINAMAWARGHRDDWNHFADVTGDPAWDYEAVLQIYRRIEDWQGTRDPAYRGMGGPIYVAPPTDPNPLAPATVEAARSVGITTYIHSNGQLMEATQGAALGDLRIRNGKRESVFRSYLFGYMDRPNLTVLTHAEVGRIVFNATKAVGVEIMHRGKTLQIDATSEVVLSLGAINTPKVLMQSGVGDDEELRRAGIPMRQYLPGVGRNFQDHVAFDCIWEYREPHQPRNNGAEAVMFAQTVSGPAHPNVFAWQIEVPYSTPETAAQFGLPEAGWTLHAALTHPKSRGRVRPTGPAPNAPLVIEANTLADPDDVKTAIACVQWCREIGNAAPLRRYVKREVMPGKLEGAELKNFIRNAATSFFHQTGTAKMGRDPMSVVDSRLKVYGLDNLRIADGSIMPEITTTNTMAPCVVIGERAAELLKADHRL